MSDRNNLSRGSHEEIEELVARCLARMATEGEQVLDAIVREHPEHAAELRERLESLRDAGLLNGPDQELVVPEVLGDHRILRRIGGGGMGEVYRALQLSLDREVALKIIRPELLAVPTAHRRFRREVETVARLKHPGVVQILAVGEDRGLPWFTMERLDGCTLSEMLDRVGARDPARLSGQDMAQAIAEASGHEPLRSALAQEAFQGSWVEACLRLVSAVALALEHVHARSVLHRDVKPSNIMVTPEGRPVLIDFGLAAIEGADRLTQAHQQPGSLPYMSPEQLLDDVEIDRRTDIYSLGVTLYELLTLQPAFPQGSAEHATRSRILDGTALPVRSRNAAIPRDAQVVCGTAMEARPARRYARAADFASDLANVLQHRPIQARPPRPWVHVQRWVQRHPALSLSSLILAAGLVVFIVLQSLELRRSESLRLTALARSLLDEDPGSALLLGIEAFQMRESRLVRNMLLASLGGLHERCTFDARNSQALDISGDGTRFASAGQDGFLRYCSLRDCREIWSTRTPEGSHGYVEFDVSGTYLLTHGRTREVFVWEAGSGRLVDSFEQDGVVKACRFAAGGKRIVIADATGLVTIRQFPGGALIAEHREEQPIYVLEVHPASGMVLVATGQRILIWEPDSGTARSLHEGDYEPRFGSLSADGRRVLLISREGLILVLSAKGGAPLVELSTPPPGGYAVFAPDGRTMAYSTAEGIFLLDTVTGEALGTLSEMEHEVAGLAFDRTGTLLASGLRDGSIQVWQMDSRTTVARFLGHSLAAKPRFSPGGRLLLSHSTDRTIRVWNLSPAVPQTILDLPNRHLDLPQMSPDGELVVASVEGAERAWTLDARTGARRKEFDHGAWLNRAEFNADGRLLALSGRDGRISLWRVRTGEFVGELLGHAGSVWFSAFSPDGRFLASASSDGTCKIWDLGSRKEVGSLSQAGAELGTVCFDPAGSRIVTGNTRWVASIYAFPSLEKLVDLRGHTSLIDRAVFSPDGLRVATCSYDRTVRVWNAQTGAQLAEFRGHQSEVLTVDFHPDGDLLVTVGKDRKARVWSIEEQAERMTIGGHFGTLLSAVFAPDGNGIVTFDRRPSLRIWPVDPYSMALDHRPRELSPAERRTWLESR